MKNKNIGFGVFLLSVGIVLFLVNIGIINWSIIDGLFELWPAIFIVIGINVIFKDNWIVRTITWLLFLTAIVSYGYFFDGGAPWAGRSNKSRTVSVEKQAETERGVFKVGLGGTRLDVRSTNVKLIDAVVSSPDIENRLSYENGKKKALVDFRRDRYVITGPDSIREECLFSLNDSIAWDMDIDAGAVNGTFDMSSLKVEKMDIDVGAGRLKMIFGNKSKTTDVDIDAGASSFDIVLPNNAGAKIKVDGALNNSNLNDLNWNRQGKYYISPNYDSAESKINMDINMGVGRFNVVVQ